MAASFERTRNFISERLADPKGFSRGTFRTITTKSGHRITVSIPKGKSTMVAQRILHPFPYPDLTPDEHRRTLRAALSAHKLRAVPPTGKKHSVWGTYLDTAKAIRASKKGKGRSNPLGPMCVNCCCGVDAASNPICGPCSRRVEFNPVSPESEIRQHHHNFHGYDPDEATVFDYDENRLKNLYDPKKLKNLWVLGRMVFVGIYRNASDHNAGRTWMFYGGVGKDAESDYRRCPTCLVPHYKRRIPYKSLPFTGVTGDGKAVVVMGTIPIGSPAQIRGRLAFIGYAPATKSRHSNTLLIHHGGDQGSPGKAHTPCSTCEFIHYNKGVRYKDLPIVRASEDGKCIVITGTKMRVGSRGIRG